MVAQEQSKDRDKLHGEHNLFSQLNQPSESLKYRLIFLYKIHRFKSNENQKLSTKAADQFVILFLSF